jgi:hypothetical protein
VANVDDAPRAVQEYLDTLDDEAFGAAKGAYHSVTVARTYKDQDGNLQDTQNFRPKDLLGLSELARRTHHETQALDREMFKEQRRTAHEQAQSKGQSQSR